MDELTDTILGVLTNIAVDVLVDVIVKTFASVMPTFNFAMPDPFGEFRC